MPKVSVIVPVYKVEPYIHRCIDSILNQSFRELELILVDDGSPDNCGAICDTYAEKDTRVHVIHQDNRGLSAARNTGIDWTFEHSESQWLTFVDSDDWIHRDFLKILLSGAEQHNTSIAMGDYWWIGVYQEDEELSYPQPLCLDAQTAIAEHYAKCMPAWGKIYKKKLFAEARFPVGKLYEDAYITHKLICASEYVTVFQEKICYYYNNPNSITRAKWTDRKLDSIEAHEQRLEYFKERGYEKAFRREQEMFVIELMDKIRQIIGTRETKDAYQKTLIMLRQKLRVALHDARAEGLVPFNRENLWCFLYAMKTDVVWKVALIAQKMYHKLKN